MAGLIALAAAALAGCGGSAPRSSATTFNDQHNQSVRCMVHQTQPPTAAYQDGHQENVEAVFQMLHYYTANGNKPYCDGRGPTATDRAWLRTYLANGATRANVARHLPATART